MASDQPSRVSTSSSDDNIESDHQLATTFSISSSTIKSTAVTRLAQAFGLLNRLVELFPNKSVPPFAQIYIQLAIDFLTGTDESEEILLCF